MLLWNQFPHLFLPLLAFVLVGLCALASVCRLEWSTRATDRTVAQNLRDEGLCAPMAVAPPSPPPSPPATTMPACADPRVTAARLREVHALRDEGLLSPEEFAEKRAQICTAISRATRPGRWPCAAGGRCAGAARKGLGWVPAACGPAGARGLVAKSNVVVGAGGAAAGGSSVGCAILGERAS
eukprot:7249939-Prymnesium_polylepis.1